MQVEKFATVQLFWSDQLGDTTAACGLDAAAVVIGGGVAGCSIAYHLARLGWTDVVVVEQHDLADGHHLALGRASSASCARPSARPA